MAEARAGNGHHAPPELVRQVLVEVAKERGLIISPKIRDIGADDGDPQWFVSVVDFLAEQDEPLGFLLEPFVYEKSFTLLAGPPKAGKTWFLGWLAAQVAAKGKKVRLVEQEGPRRLLRARMRPFLAPEPAAYKNVLSIAHRAPLRLDNRKSVDSLISQIRGTELLILDPLAMLHEIEENEQAQMNVVVQAVLRIIGEVGCAIVLVHHTKKGESWQKKSSIDGESVDVRGSGALVGAADSVIFLKSVPEEDRKAAQIRFFVSNPDTRLGEPFERRLAVVTFADEGKAGDINFYEPEKASQRETAVNFLARVKPHVPAAPDFISIELLADKAGMRKAHAVLAVELGCRQGYFQRARAGRKQGVQLKPETT